MHFESVAEKTTPLLKKSLSRVVLILRCAFAKSINIKALFITVSTSNSRYKLIDATLG